MIAFAWLLERLTLTPGRLAKIALMVDFFAREPDPDRGWALAALTGELSFTAAKAGLIRSVAEARVDPVLFRLSYDFVGDLAETVALIWPQAGDGEPPSVAEIVGALRSQKKANFPDLLSSWLDRSDANVRYAIIKFMTGGLRAGASARLAKAALAAFAVARGQDIAVEAIEEIWHGLAPPYESLFAWVEGSGAQPSAAGAAMFRPPMLAHPVDAEDLTTITPADYTAEWKWDGIRVQLVQCGALFRIFSRGGDDISAAFPEFCGCLSSDVVLDGELLVVRDGVVAPFADLQQRLNRKTASPKLLRDFPAQVRLYDILIDGNEDIRGLPFLQRRARLEDWMRRALLTATPALPAAAGNKKLMDLSPLIPFSRLEELAAIRAGARAASIEGLMLKRNDSAYLAGRPRGYWWKWKRDPLSIDAVLMYAQRGHGKRSSFYSDYTFGVWRADGALVPVGKAYSGFTDEELVKLDRWIRNNTVKTYGPVREVSHGMVLEIAFDAVQRSGRHKSGVALRFPRVARLRWDKTPSEADQLESLERLIG